MFVVLLLLGALPVQAPEPAQKPVIENTGKPMHVPVQCTDDDMRAFGLTCPPQQPCPVYVELAAIEAAGNKLFLTGNLHTEATTLASILLASDDAGKTWYEAHERLRGAGLDHIQFLDFDTGWISGQTLGAVPRDPFLLLTRDGGKTWRARPLWDESRVGVIDSFRFDSRNHGSLWIDRTPSGEGGTRYELYESMTGGESWMLREAATKPLRKPDRGSGPTAWRVRVEAASHSYRIERLAEGERWQPAAAFLVRAGECRQAEVSLPPAPPEAEAAKPEVVEPAPQPPPAAPKKPPSLKKPRP